jgi:hypothetical protein
MIPSIMELEIKRLQLLDVNRRKKYVPLMIRIMENQITKNFKNANCIIKREIEINLFHGHYLLSDKARELKSSIWTTEEIFTLREDEMYLTEEEVYNNKLVKEIIEKNYLVSRPRIYTQSRCHKLYISWHENYSSKKGAMIPNGGFQNFNTLKFLYLMKMMRNINLFRTGKIFYNPKNLGGKLSKRNLEREFGNIQRELKY